MFEPKPFGKYFLTERIAIGGMAEIYKAKTFGVDGFEKLLAIKKILPHYSADKEFISMLSDEAKLVVRLSHTNIVQIYDLGKVGDDYYISMEFIDGVNLREVINRGKEFKEKVPLPVCLYIISEICKGLDYAHSKRDDHGQPLHIVHRDISPQNILISFEGEPKIVDFGIAKAAMNVSHTTAGILKGKVTYMSSEQALGKPVDGRTDLFSAGLLLYELITGERFFSGDTQLGVLNMIRSTHINQESLSGRVPGDIIPILAKALAYNSNDRYESAGDFQIALTKMLYSQYSDFSPKQLAALIKKWFEAELKIKRKQTSNEVSSIDSHTRSVLQKAKGQKSIVAAEENKKGLKKLLQDTTKPEDGITSASFRDPSQTRPEKISRKRRDWGSFLTKRRLTAGTVVLLAVLLGFGFYQKFIKEDPAQGQIDIISTPEEAQIFVDGKNSGEETPASIERLKIKRDYFIRIQKEGYQPFEEKIFIPSQEPVILKTTLIPIPYGNLNVRSEPSGARILIDGEETEQITPADLKKLEIGKSYQVKLVKGGFVPFEKKIEIVNENPISLEASLMEIILGTIEISSKPEGATIFLNGKNTEIETPGTIEKLDVPQTVELTLRKDKFNEATRSIEIEGGKPIQAHFKLELMEEYRVGTIQIDVNVPESVVKLNNQRAGLAPGNFESKPGKIEIQLEKEGYQKTSKTINLKEGDFKKLSFQLIPIKTEKPPVVIPDRKKPPVDDQPERPTIGGVGEIRVDSTPRGAGVVFDGQKAGITPVVIPKVAQGTKHTVVVSLPGYQNWTKTFTLSQNRIELTAQMQKE